jgi:hypothetical protein
MGTEWSGKEEIQGHVDFYPKNHPHPSGRYYSTLTRNEPLEM